MWLNNSGGYYLWIIVNQNFGFILYLVMKIFYAFHILNEIIKFKKNEMLYIKLNLENSSKNFFYLQCYTYFIYITIVKEQESMQY